MPELPVSADGIVAGEDAAVASENLERNGLPCNLGAACPHNSPVAGHSDPSGILPLDVDGADVTSSSDVVNEDHHEVWVTVQLEPHSATLVATHLLVDNGDNSSRLSGEAVESGHGQVKVLPGRIAPPSTGSRWAEVRGRDNDRLGEGIAPASGICAGRVASKRIASSTYCSSVPQGGAQGSCVHSVAHGVGVSIPTSSAHSAASIRGTVIRDVTSAICCRMGHL